MDNKSDVNTYTIIIITMFLNGSHISETNTTTNRRKLHRLDRLIHFHCTCHRDTGTMKVASDEKCKAVI